jgi:tetratricopeptide (TPR) repeat protein
MQQYHKSLELDPHHYLTQLQIGNQLLFTGKPHEAIRAYEAIPPHLTHIAALRSLAYTRADRIDEARKIAEELHQRAQQAYVPAIAFAIICLSLGEMEKSFDWFDKAVDERNEIIIQLIRTPLFDPLRSHPRYRALLRKMNLEA